MLSFILMSFVSVMDCYPGVCSVSTNLAVPATIEITLSMNLQSSNSLAVNDILLEPGIHKMEIVSLSTGIPDSTSIKKYYLAFEIGNSPSMIARFDGNNLSIFPSDILVMDYPENSVKLAYEISLYKSVIWKIANN